MSKALEALRSIKDSLTQDGNILEYTPEYKTIEKELKIMENTKLCVSEYTAYYINLVLRITWHGNASIPLFIIAKDEKECDAFINAINCALWCTSLDFAIFRYKDRICGSMFVPENFEAADQITKIVGLCEAHQVYILSKEELDKMFAPKNEEENKND